MKTQVILLDLMTVFMNTEALAKSADIKVYMLMDDGGEHPIEKCEVRNKLPMKSTKTKIFSSVRSYLGTVQTEFASKNEAGIDMYQHYFSNEADCAAVIKTLNY